METMVKFKTHHTCPFVWYGEVYAQFTNGEFETADTEQIEYLRNRADVEEIG